ncbi:zinc dependent phospholipase C family protein [Brassicibacter mesophilus]|uniref:zinc dependent phospholipase C family protein n=1 Tax=Brassicibacter mesophilus TaxID=745119 RepID=UPI003D20B03E
MASRIIHYIISKKILEICNFDKNDFILGNLLPDAHNGTLYGNSHSHFRYIINGEYTKLPNIEYVRFKQKYFNYFYKSLFLGYYCHLLSDYKWVQLKIPGFPNNLDNDTKEFLAFRKILHDDYGKLNMILKDYFKLSLQDNFVIPDDIIITEIDRSNIPKVLNGLEQDFKSRTEGRLSMLTMEFILDYIDNTVKFCLENIERKL